MVTFFPQISDKLLNTIQLSSILNENNNLIAGSIDQKWNEIKHIDFNEAIPSDENKRYAFKFLFLPSLFLIAILIFKPFIVTKGSEKILLFNKAYTEEAPFDFFLKTENLKVLKNESIDLELAINGENIPEEAFILINGRKQKLEKKSLGVLYNHLTKFYTKTLIFNSKLQVSIRLYIK